ncbi:MULTISPECIES: hypothetical protein [Comamonas]|uniref:hypothetical protein n=1 Tax=Comamonas TaxID=283 RepID=UPI0001DA6CCC|nr:MULTISPECIES: hypothetical protein [Comamonas]EFI63637.1 hypothetical protein CTS44_00853 [Comamonas thiooxydans]TFF55242.1 hypothetical protein EIC84_23590 [Comamonas sp. A23]
MDEEVIKFRDQFDNDKGLQSVRKLLVTTCMIFLALNLTGASIEEANTFIFKIKFSNYKGLSYLFAATIIFLTIRYYSFAQPYHKRINDYWIARLMLDTEFFYYDKQSQEVKGLLQEAIVAWGGDYPGIQHPRYKFSGFFRRSIEYDFLDHFEGEDGRTEQYIGTHEIKLHSFTEKWTACDYKRVFFLEFKYQIDALFRHRENLDLFAPYMLSIVTILAFSFKGEILRSI